MAFKIATQQRSSIRISRSTAKTSSSTRVRPTGYDLQRTIGNSATGRLFRTGYSQPKLTVSNPGDTSEREADRVADKVMRMPETQPGLTVQRFSLAIQRKCATCEEERKQQSMHDEDEEEKIVQAKPVEASAAPQVTSGLESRINNIRGGGQPLPESARAFFEPRFGHDFGQVRVHADTRASESARAVHAKAYTVGRDVVFGNGNYSPQTTAGRALLAHELTHVVQQGAGGVTVQRAPADSKDCAKYDTNEVSKSRTEDGLLNNDVFIPGAMSLIDKKDDIVIADFGVDRGSVKDSTKANPVLQQWINAFENNSEYWLEIEGYSDCVGVERYNAELRHRRAAKVFQLFRKARSRVRFHKAAPQNEYLRDNGDVEGRAVNRGVTIHFGRTMTLPGDVIEVPVPKPPKPVPKPKIPTEEPDTDDCDKTQRDALARAFPLAKRMARAAIRATADPMSPDEENLLRKYFGKDAVAHKHHIRANFVSILGLLNYGPSFSCENANGWWCDGAVARVIPIIGRYIHICPSAIAQGDDFLARTIIHESAHGEFLYGEQMCAGGCPHSLDTEDAESNADSYGEFAGDALTQSP
jgi:outer membrane protein OmpA-like peptidoglycan-associated protein